jgi:hypothetical protein
MIHLNYVLVKLAEETQTVRFIDISLTQLNDNKCAILETPVIYFMCKL